ncbi:cytochrome c peroxidase [Desulfurobacterium pacificum]|uniref:Cytochrome c peroxidase n=1 Tax=Desulfurobacterium pacificum TaxID=240166 RepID=A0ABY1NDB0_9BACT|nr:cytochrome-c peroxidase [Desulfurobacterium pacificum]SMP06851.1 cytochrome c peroxidase [Desulfurobacterium pacificum]
MRKFLVAMTLTLMGATFASAGVWETTCSNCHGKIAPSKEQLLAKFRTPKELLSAAKKKVKEGRMPSQLAFGIAARELFSKPVRTAAITKGTQDFRKFFTPLPALPPIPKDNSLTPVKVKLGKMLYYDPRLSRSNLISCNTCHNLAIGGDDNLKSSRGDHWRTGGRNAPTTLNSGFLRVQFWDGRAPTLEEQAKGPLQAHVEMNSTPELVVERLKKIPTYVKLFKEAFPNEKDPVTFENVVKAIAAFERTLNTPNSPFQRYLLGDDNALTPVQKEGMKLFVKYGCIACHNGPVLSDGMFHRFKSNDDTGRYRVTKNPADKYKFRTPQLLNVAVTAPYFHDGSAKTLGEAIKRMAQQELGKTLSDSDVEKIKAFLESLTGEVPLEARTVPQLP